MIILLCLFVSVKIPDNAIIPECHNLISDSIICFIEISFCLEKQSHSIQVPVHTEEFRLSTVTEFRISSDCSLLDSLVVHLFLCCMETKCCRFLRAPAFFFIISASVLPKRSLNITYIFGSYKVLLREIRLSLLVEKQQPFEKWWFVMIF